MDELQKIRVVGCGGAGCNAINNLMQYFEKHNFLIAMNTDAASLASTHASCKIQLGYTGNGAGSDPNQGKMYAEQSAEEIKIALAGAELVILCAGLGGGTGSGASRVVASIAKEIGSVVIGFFTMPFRHDGTKKAQIANESLEELKKICDFVCILSNDELVKVAHDKSLKEAFLFLDKIYATFIYTICNFVSHNQHIQSVINCDFEDLKTFLRKSGEGWIGTGYGDGDEAVKNALSQLYNNPIVSKIPIEQAGSMINTIIINEHVKMKDISDLLDEISSKNHSAHIKNGIFIADAETIQNFPNTIQGKKEAILGKKIIIISSAFTKFSAGASLSTTGQATNGITDESSEENSTNDQGDKPDKNKKKKSVFGFW